MTHTTTMKTWFPRFSYYPGLCDVERKVCTRSEPWAHNWQWLACFNRREIFSH